MTALDFDEYQHKAGMTAKYPGSGTGSALALSYVALGLAGESGETVEHIKKALRKGGKPEDFYERREELKAEMGDVLWYLSTLADELGLRLRDIAFQNIAKLSLRDQEGTILAGR